MGRCIKEDEEHVSTCSEEKKIEIGLFWEIKMSIHLKAIFTYCWREFFSTPLWRYNDDHRGVRAVIWSKSVPIWMSGKQLDPPCFPPPSLYGDLYFWIVSRCFVLFFITGMQNMPKACSSHCHLYGMETSHFILMLAQEDRVHSQFRKERRIPTVRETTRNCWRCMHVTTQH